MPIARLHPGQPLETETTPNPGRKDDQGKCRLDLIPPAALVALGEVYTHGAQKYDDNNWMKGLHFSRVIGALERHLARFKMGEDTDQESRCLHMASVAWCAMTLMHFTLYSGQYSQFDDRMKAPMIDVRATTSSKHYLEHGDIPE